MKSLIFLMLSPFAFMSVNAQQLKGQIEGLKIYKDSLLLNQDYTFNVPNSKFLYDTEKGKVYQLPLDNMKCLIPSISSNMPVATKQPENTRIAPVPIPNPFTGKESLIIPPVNRIPRPH